MHIRFYLLCLLFMVGFGYRTPAQTSRPLPVVKKRTAALSEAVNNQLLYGYNQFRNKFSFERNESSVRFFLLGYKDARHVVVTGPFTDWSITRLEMRKTDSGWVADHKLAPGRYPYKFVIDDSVLAP